MTRPDTRADSRPAAEIPRTHVYSIAGIPCTVSAIPAVLDRVDDTYGAFRTDSLTSLEDPLAVELRMEGAGFVLTDSSGFRYRSDDDREAVVATFNQLVQGVVARLADRGIYAIHAASLVYQGGACVISGVSESGKTTLAVALLARGLQLLSDEFALSAPDARTILPYRRGLHIRPGTPELVPELRFLEDQPRYILGGGSEWSLLPAELERTFPGCLGEAAPLRHVVLLNARTSEPVSVLEPLPAALAAVELTRAMPAAVDHFAAVLARTTRRLEGVQCGRLTPGALDSSLDVLLGWLGSSHD